MHVSPLHSFEAAAEGAWVGSLVPLPLRHSGIIQRPKRHKTISTVNRRGHISANLLVCAVKVPDVTAGTLLADF